MLLLTLQTNSCGKAINHIIPQGARWHRRAERVQLGAQDVTTVKGASTAALLNVVVGFTGGKPQHKDSYLREQATEKSRDAQVALTVDYMGH